jgi:hypothetical protein
MEDRLSLLKARLKRISANFKSAYADSAGYVSPVAGREREVFVHGFLEGLLPASLRIGAGVITDASGRATGQVDVVIELPMSVSFPIVGENRHYLADTVGAAIEVKSDLYSQWDKAKAKAADVKQLARIKVEKDEIVNGRDYHIPFFIVAFTGPKTIETLNNYLAQLPPVDRPDGIYIVDSDLFVGSGAGGWREAKGSAEAAFCFVTLLFSHLHRRRDAAADFDHYESHLFGV